MITLRFALLCLSIFLAVGLSATDYALFFAVEDYDQMGKLTNPIDNATAIAAELKANYGFQTEVVPNPTFVQIADKIAEYQQKFASGAYDQKGQLLVFFSGHGVQRGNNGYFMPKDGNPTKLYEKVIEYDNWRYEIDQIACQHILVTIDACHSLTFDPNWKNKTDRNFGRRGDATKDQVLLDHKAYRSRLFFTSDGTNNQTPDRSTLARQFLTGLRTHRSGNGYLPADELYASYLKRAAPVPGGGDFGQDEPGSRFLFFRKLAPVPVDARADIAAWNQAKASNNCTAYRNYLQQFANGDFAGLARQQIIACEEEEQMLAAWAAVRASNRRDQYEDFLKKYPNSPYTEAVNLKLAEFEATMREILLLGSDKKEEDVPDNMVFIPGGSFQMGDQFGGGESNERPIHAVKLADFYLSRTELTNREYAEFLSAQGNQEQGGSEWYAIGSSYAGISGSGRSFIPKSGQDDHPVLVVSWYGAVAYCNWLSGQHGLTPVYRISGTTVTPNWSANGYRLPTEAEWEYAARSGGKKEKWAGTSTENELTQFANYSGTGDGYKSTAPVGVLRANNLGLGDMSGNVWEWCWDWYGSDYYGKSPSSNPKGPETGSIRVFRGGSWDFSPANCRAANRNYGYPTSRYNDVGFRLARSSRQGE